MDTELLVENNIDEGANLIAELRVDGFDVSVAFWAKTSEEGLWFLYIGSTSVVARGIGDNYRTAYGCLSRLPNSSITISEIKLIQANNPIAQDAMALRDRQSGRVAIKFANKRFGMLSIDEGYIYPRVGGPMTRSEILHWLTRMANRPPGSVVTPSSITLRDGSRVNRLITGFQMEMPGELIVQTRDASSSSNQPIRGDEIVEIN